MWRRATVAISVGAAALAGGGSHRARGRRCGLWGVSHRAGNRRCGPGGSHTGPVAGAAAGLQAGAAAGLRRGVGDW